VSAADALIAAGGAGALAASDRVARERASAVYAAEFLGLGGGQDVQPDTGLKVKGTTVAAIADLLQVVHTVDLDVVHLRSAVGMTPPIVANRRFSSVAFSSRKKPWSPVRSGRAIRLNP
jgi:hypothetical protein